MKTLVTFESNTFNTTEPKEYFINPNCYGGDVCLWLMHQLNDLGVVVTDQEPQQEDFGWYFNFKTPAGKHCLVCGHRPGDSNNAFTWVMWVERSYGFIGSILGKRNQKISSKVIDQIHQILSNSENIHNLWWYNQKDFDAGKEELGTPQP